MTDPQEKIRAEILNTVDELLKLKMPGNITINFDGNSLWNVKLDLNHKGIEAMLKEIRTAKQLIENITGS